MNKNQHKNQRVGFPGGSAVRSPLANAGDTGLEPWSGRIPHAVEGLSLCATTTEATCHNY